jgi:hypothetical protein
VLSRVFLRHGAGRGNLFPPFSRAARKYHQFGQSAILMRVCRRSCCVQSRVASENFQRFIAISADLFQGNPRAGLLVFCAGFSFRKAVAHAIRPFRKPQQEFLYLPDGLLDPNLRFGSSLTIVGLLCRASIECTFRVILERARCSLAFTVPTGTPKIRAASLAGSSCI